MSTAIFYAQCMLCWGISILYALFMQAKKKKKTQKTMSVCELSVLTQIGKQVKLQRRRPASTLSVAVSTGLQGTSSLLGFYVCFTPCSPVPLLKPIL